MKKFYALTTLAVVFCTCSWAQSFSNSTALLPSTYHSGGVVGVTDMNNDGYDDIIIMDESTDLYIAYQNMDGTFTEEFYGTVSGDQQWGMAVGNMDNDDHLDVLSGGYYDNVQVMRITSQGNGDQVELDDPSGIFMQACNFGDINNDGWLDVFACHDDGPARIWINDGAGNLVHNTTAINTSVYAGSDNSGNYGSVFSDVDRDGDLDLFVAKCRQFINDPYDPRRTNLLFINDGNNNYTDEAPERGLVNLQQSWTVDFADVDNDGDFDCLLTTHSGTLELYLNDGAGYFTEVTLGSGLDVSAFFLQAKFADFDNDGFVDLVHSGGTHRFFHNNGDLTFTEMEMFPYTDEMHSFAIGDLNHDGHLDLYASYGDGYVDADNSHPDRLWLNEGNDNHFVVFDLEGTISNKQAVGAIVEIHGQFGTQVREVRAGESYGISTCFATHFGIGDFTGISEAIIYWPSGIVTVIENPSIDTVHQIFEEDCSAPEVSISANGSTSICPGSSLNITVNGDTGSFFWSNGASTSSITVTESGNYSVTTWDNEGCGAISNIITVDIIESETPQVSINGPTEFCEGESVQLISSSANGYAWSNGENTQAISVTESGSYVVTIEGQCDDYDSAPVAIIVYDAPNAPSVSDITIDTPGTATFEVTGSDIRWYASEIAVSPIGTGSSFTTPFVDATTSFWVEDVATYGGIIGNGGALAPSTEDPGQYHNSSGYWNKFDVHEDIYIESVRVFAGNAGNRTIRVVDNLGVTVAEATVSVPEGESVVDLNLFVPEGVSYGLRCTDTNPQLWRDKNLDEASPYGFPYDLNGLATITGTTVQGNDSDNYYYFFYDWVVSSVSFECPGDRVEVQVIVLGVEELAGVNNLNVFPNPANELLNVNFDLQSANTVTVQISDAIGRVIYSNQMIANSGLNNHILNVSEWAAGVYNLEFSINGATSTTRLMVK
ncbi:MAG: FG-GAP-like repeat-containing protein [Flavobacteriales bacterium]|nr:FG-GAP-like repeat-containing protein [Flavobacteriales bacterium]